MARSAIYAIVFSLLVICAYVAFRFEPKYAVPVIIAVIHDILITGGVYSLTGREVTSGTVAAFLTILGYSLYDTVIVFDRIRENVPRLPRATFSQIVNRSMSEVLTRSLITGLSSVFLIGVLLIFGGETLRDFAFAMMVGIASGTYFVDLHRLTGAHPLEGARARVQAPPRADRRADGPCARLPRGQRDRPGGGGPRALASAGGARASRARAGARAGAAGARAEPVERARRPAPPSPAAAAPAGGAAEAAGPAGDGRRPRTVRPTAPAMASDGARGRPRSPEPRGNAAPSGGSSETGARARPARRKHGRNR